MNTGQLCVVVSLICILMSGPRSMRFWHTLWDAVTWTRHSMVYCYMKHLPCGLHCTVGKIIFLCLQLLATERLVLGPENNGESNWQLRSSAFKLMKMKPCWESKVCYEVKCHFMPDFLFLFCKVTRTFLIVNIGLYWRISLHCFGSIFSSTLSTTYVRLTKNIIFCLLLFSIPFILCYALAKKMRD